MSTELATQNYSRDQIELIKTTVCKGASDLELKLFLEQSKRLGLDPLSRQIYAIKRWDKKEGRETMVLQISIDGFRLTAERTGKYAGQIGPMWCGEDGVWKEVWLSSKPPAAAKIGVLRTDFKEPLWATARFEAYAQRTRDGKLTQFWEKMGDLMIGKVCESLALRKAFPNELSGFYSQEEMDQADASTPEAKPQAPVAIPDASNPPKKRPVASAVAERIEPAIDVEATMDAPVLFEQNNPDHLAIITAWCREAAVTPAWKKDHVAKIFERLAGKPATKEHIFAVLDSYLKSLNREMELMLAREDAYPGGTP